MAVNYSHVKLKSVTIRGGSLPAIINPPFGSNYDDGGGIAIYAHPSGLSARSATTVKVVDSTVTHNFAGGSGGGIACLTYPWHLILANSTVTGNVAADNGGGVLLPFTSYLSWVSSRCVQQDATKAGSPHLQASGFFSGPCARFAPRHLHRQLPGGRNKRPFRSIMLPPCHWRLAH